MDWFEKVPKELSENLRFREWLLFKAGRDKGLQRALKQLCKDDIIFWFNALAFTFDPRLKQKTIPFITYPYQDEAIAHIRDAINDGENLVLPKSRTMGASWLIMACFDHFATFQSECRFFALSRNAEMVDDSKNDNCLFAKIDFIHSWLPSWLRPEVDRTNMAIVYPETRAAINGGSTAKAAMVGGRATAGVVDEFSRYEPTAAEIIKAGLGPITPCIIWPFTRSPEMGKLHPCQELVDQGKRGDIRYFPMHWTAHPVCNVGHYTVDPVTRRVEVVDKAYDFSDYKFQLDGRFRHHSEWFDRERKKNGPDRVISANYEFDDDINDHLVYDPLMIREYIAQHAREPDLTGDILYDEVTGDVKEFVLKQGGPISLWLSLDRHNDPPDIPYMAAADVSLGVGTTNSCLSVGRCDTGEMILEFATPFMKPDQFAVKCVAICNWLNSGSHRTVLCWERQGPGETFGNKVSELNYYPRWKAPTDFIRARVGGYTEKEGFSPQQNRTLHTTHEAALRNRTFINHSKLSLEETLQYENTMQGPKHKADRNRKNDPSGATVNHGDRCTSAAICCYIMHQRGIVNAKVEEKIPPGSLADFMRQREAKEARNKTLFPNWSKQRA